MTYPISAMKNIIMQLLMSLMRNKTSMLMLMQYTVIQHVKLTKWKPSIKILMSKTVM